MVGLRGIALACVLALMVTVTPTSYAQEVTTQASAANAASILDNYDDCGEDNCDHAAAPRWILTVALVRAIDGDTVPTLGPVRRFSDVGADHPYVAYIERAAALGITNGCGDGTRFCPDDQVTRGQTAAMIVRGFGLPPDTSDGAADFGDVSEGHVFEDEINAISAAGITIGCGDGSDFCVGNSVSVSQVSTFLNRSTTFVAENPEVLIPTTTTTWLEAPPGPADTTTTTTTTSTTTTTTVRYNPSPAPTPSDDTLRDDTFNATRVNQNALRAPLAVLENDKCSHGCSGLQVVVGSLMVTTNGNASAGDPDNLLEVVNLRSQDGDPNWNYAINAGDPLIDSVTFDYITDDNTGAATVTISFTNATETLPTPTLNIDRIMTRAATIPMDVLGDESTCGGGCKNPTVLTQPTGAGSVTWNEGDRVFEYSIGEDVDSPTGQTFTYTTEDVSTPATVTFNVVSVYDQLNSATSRIMRTNNGIINNVQQLGAIDVIIPLLDDDNCVDGCPGLQIADHPAWDNVFTDGNPFNDDDDPTNDNTPVFSIASGNDERPREALRFRWPENIPISNALIHYKTDHTGLNSKNQLDVGRHTITVALLTIPVAISVTDNSLCTVRSDNHLSCEGDITAYYGDSTHCDDAHCDNDDDHCDDGHCNLKWQHPTSGSTAVSVGVQHGCSLSTHSEDVGNGQAGRTVSCWGGLGSDRDPDDEDEKDRRVDDTPEMLIADEIVAGFGYSCAVGPGGGRCWGISDWVTVNQSKIELPDHCDKDLPNPMRPPGCRDLENIVTDTVYLTFEKGIHDLSSGGNHFCGVRHSTLYYSDGRGEVTTQYAECHGDNTYGQKTPPRVSDGNGNMVEPQFSHVAAGWRHTCGIRLEETDDQGNATAASNTVMCWGSNTSGQASAPTGTFKALAAGREHTCGIRTNGTVYCWGSNAYGESTPPSGTFSTLDTGGFETCREVKPDPQDPSTWYRDCTYRSFTCGITADDNIRVRCWGSKDFGYRN